MVLIFSFLFTGKKKKKKLNGVDKEQTIAYFRGIFLAIWK
jgi:hypothetical protein